jgi:hypothetical protein
MRHIVTMFGVSAMTVFAFSAIAVTASASESTKVLPEPTVASPIIGTGTLTAAGHVLTVGGLALKCAKSSGSGSWTSANSGMGETLLTECKGPLSTVCTGEGDPEGLIGAKGEVFFWLALLMTGTKEKETTELVAAAVVLSPAGGIKVTCVNKAKTIEDKIVTKGCAAAQVSPASLNKLITEAKGESSEWSSGETKILKVLPPGATEEINCLPTISINGGAEELAAGTGMGTISKFEKGGKAITIALMNP